MGKLRLGPLFKVIPLGASVTQGSGRGGEGGHSPAESRDRAVEELSPFISLFILFFCSSFLLLLSNHPVSHSSSFPRKTG